MKTNKIVIPIEATTLAHYYSRACIAPISYLKRGHHDAIQSNYPNALLLTKHYGVKGSNCYLVVRMTEQEFSSSRVHTISDGFMVYEGALPISRVDEIVFCSEEQKNITITNVEMGDAFVDGCKISVNRKFEQVEIPAAELSVEKDEQLAMNLKEYDRILGALMFMRLAKEQDTTYSDNFLQTLALFSPYISDQLNKLEIEQSSKYESFFEDKYKSFRAILQHLITEDDVCDMAYKQNTRIKINPINGYDFNALSKNMYVYILALLQNFSLVEGDGGRDKIDDLILNGFYSRNFITKGKAETFAFYYGYNRGYDKFRNAYKLDKKCVNVKFSFRSLFEKFISEEVFAYCVTPELVTSDILSKLEVLGADNKFIDAKKIGEDTYQILDTKLIVKKKLEGMAPNQKPSPVSGPGSSDSSLIDERCALFLEFELKTKNERKAIAKKAGLDKSKLIDEKEVYLFLLHLSLECLEELYKANVKSKCDKPKSIKASEKVAAKKGMLDFCF